MTNVRHFHFCHLLRKFRLIKVCHFLPKFRKLKTQELKKPIKSFFKNVDMCNK